MSTPARAPSGHPPNIDRSRPLYKLPDDAIPPEEQALLGQRDSVDGDAAIAWLEGEGPDPWQQSGSSS